MDYRREIDGLRAIAVVPVILFHAGFKAFGGGFVGVDVFFVISGYLITSILIAELEQNKFSIVNFYERRARRILPALVVVMTVSWVLAWLWLPASDMREFSQSLTAVSLFSSNIFFWSKSGYFDTATELKPLLHTWSLAVEEQYYFFFPLFLMIVWRLGKRRILALLTVLALASFAVAQRASVYNPSFAFYLLPTRVWELLVGVFAAFYLHKNGQKELSRGLSEFLGWLGLGLIAFSVVAYGKETPFPGVYALAPTIGAVLLIAFASQKTLVGRFVGNRVFVGLGLISYSAYLWHQPLFAFARHASSTEPMAQSFLLLSALTLILAYFSWRFVEGPFRNKAWITRKGVFRSALVSSLVFILMGTIGKATKGFEKKGPEAIAHVEPRTHEDLIILGDSHGGHLHAGLKAMTTGSVDELTSSSCIPLRNVDRSNSSKPPGECVGKINRFLDKLTSDDPKATIIMSSMGPVYLDGTPFNGKDLARVTGARVELITDKALKDNWKIYEIGLRATLAELSKLKNSKVVFAIDIPELGIDYGCAKRQKKIDLGLFQISDLVDVKDERECFVSRKSYDLRADRYKYLVKRVVAEFPNVRIFDPTPYFCNSDICKGFDPKFGFLYRDTDHLSETGSLFLATKMMEFLQVN